MKNIESIIHYLEEKAKDFGAKNKDDFQKDYVLRKNINPEAFQNNGAFFGFIHPDEEATGPYHDLSLVIFPDKNNGHWAICLGVGTLGFKNDFELAAIPGVRRLFHSLIKNEQGFCKTNFLDIETPLPKSFLEIEKISGIRKTLEKYKKKLF